MRINSLKLGYFSLMVFLAIFIILTPHLITDGFSVFTEEAIEGFIVALLLFAGAGIDFLYRREMSRQQRKINEAWKHVGRINLLIERLSTAFIDINKYPENKRDVKQLFELMSDKILGLADYQFVLFRIVEPETMQTLSEFFKPRSGTNTQEPRIGNKELMENKLCPNLDIIGSEAENITIKIFCVVPKTPTSENQKIFIQKIVNDFTMLYIISASNYYKK